MRSALCSPALRRSSDRLPTEAASQIFCAPTVSTSSVTAFATAALAGAIVRALIDREHARILQHHFGGGVALFHLAREHDIDAIARQHEAADAFDIVDAHRDRLHAVADQGRQAWRADRRR